MTKQWHVLIVHRIPRDRGWFGQISLARPPAPWICNGIPRFCTLLKGLDARPWFIARETMKGLSLFRLRAKHSSSRFKKKEKKNRSFEIGILVLQPERESVRAGDEREIYSIRGGIMRVKSAKSRDPLLLYSLWLYNARGESFNVWRNFMQTPARETRKACLRAYRIEKVEKRVARH